MASNPDMSVAGVTLGEHIDPAITGDNISAKRTALYVNDVIDHTWSRAGFGPSLVQKPYDYVAFSNADGNGNYQTAIFKSGGSSGTTVGTLALTYDANNLITSITRT